MRSMRQTARILLPAFTAVLMLGVGGAAQAACYSSGQQLPANVVSQFVNDPGKLLTQFPSGGSQMISLIRDLVASDPGVLPLIINLNAKANTEQVQAMGAGLGQAALVCRRTAQAFSNEIQRMTITADNRPLIQAFSAVMGDLFLGSAGPAGGGGGGLTGTGAAVVGVAAGSGVINLTTSVPTAGLVPAVTVSGATASVAPSNGAVNQTTSVTTTTPAVSVSGTVASATPSSHALNQTTSVSASGLVPASSVTASVAASSSVPSVTTSLTTSVTTVSSNSVASNLFTSPTSGSSAISPVAQSNSIITNSISAPNSIAKSVSRSSP